MKHKIISFILKLVGLTLCVFFWDTAGFWWIIGLYFAVYAAVNAAGSFIIQWNYYIKSVCKGRETGLVLTFDDGPDPEVTPKILSVLKDYNAKATFFLIGQKAEQYPHLVKQIFDEGHILANHSYSHRKTLPFFPAKKLKQDFERCSQVIKSITGKYPVFVRPPFGVTSPPYYKMMQKTPFVSIGWSFRSLDTMQKDVVKLVRNTQNAVIKNDRPILLFHDTQQVTLAALPEILQFIRENEISLTSLEQSIQTSAYEKH